MHTHIEGADWGRGTTRRPRRATPITVCVTPDDAIDAARRVQLTTGVTPLVLNMASPTNPGGAVASDVIAQEETLFRRTNYHQPLTTRRVRYPLPEDVAVVTRNVVVVKDRALTRLAEADRFVLDFVACAAERLPSSSTTVGPATRGKVRAILQAAVVTGHTHLVLGAFGYPPLGNPPGAMAEMFRLVLIDEEYAEYFDHVEFAVLVTSKKTPNNDVFWSILHGIGPKNVSIS